MPGPSEWIIVAIVAIVVIFGAKKIPEMARSMGRAQSEFKKGIKEGQAELGETPPAASPPPAAATPQPAAPPTPAPSTDQVADQAPGSGQAQ
jgi:sec-independent protein translocase protein TatA